MKTDIKSLTYEQLNNAVLELGLPKFRTKQIFNWLHFHAVTSFDDMTNISKELKEKLKELKKFDPIKYTENIINQL